MEKRMSICVVTLAVKLIEELNYLVTKDTLSLTLLSSSGKATVET